MNYVDILVLISVLIIVGLIVWFMIKDHKKGQCSSCPMPKKAKRMIADFRKENKKKQDQSSK